MDVTERQGEIEKGRDRKTGRQRENVCFLCLGGRKNHGPLPLIGGRSCECSIGAEK